jgi:microcin C transport system substrate-binding protein
MGGASAGLLDLRPVTFRYTQAFADGATPTQYGLIAETMEVPDDLSYVIFHLRPEAHWQDGTPITVDDVIFSVEILTGELAHPGYRAYFKNLVGADAVGPNSVRINFESEDLNRELPTIAGQMPVLSKVYWSTHDFGETTLEPWMGSGPYTIKSMDTPSSITWELDPNYWGKDLPINIGKTISAPFGLIITWMKRLP